MLKKLRFSGLGDDPRGAQRGTQQQQPQQQRQGQQQQQQQQQQLQPLQPQQQREPLTSWTGVAKQIQGGLRGDESLRGHAWPCMKLFLTGQCGIGAACKACSKDDGLKGRGDRLTRAAAAKRLGEVMKATPISPDLAKDIASGEKERA